jgi:hypothetical protein
MSTEDPTGRTRFAAGMRVSREHLDHLQEVSLEGDRRLREALGPGRVAHGFRVVPVGPARVRVEPGFAMDGALHPLRLDEPRELELPAAGPCRVVLVHGLRGELPMKGTPTVYVDELHVELRGASPPYADNAVACAVVEAGETEARVRPLGEAYLPAPDHHHTGTFRLGADRRWRYDGMPLGLGVSDFDSGVVRMDPGQSRDLDHGLGTRDMLVTLEAYIAAAGANPVPDAAMRTTRGLGSDYWYEIEDDNAIRLCRGAATDAFPGELHLRARIWAPGASDPPAVAQPRRPVADAGPDREVPGDAPFTLDGGASRAFGSRSVVRFRWSRLS